MDLKDYIVDVPNFPKEGILFKDITNLMKDGDAFHQACQELIDFAREQKAEIVMGPEARGFIFGCPVSYALNIGFVPVRKPGKLPRETVECKYDLEYGSNTLCIHKDSIRPGQRVLIIDDLLATGGTVLATIDLVKQLGGVVCGIAFLSELEALNGREKLKDYPVKTLLTL